MTARKRNPKRVLIVEGSQMEADLIREAVDGDPRLTVVGWAPTGEEALQAIASLGPDAVAMGTPRDTGDCRQSVRRIMQVHPTPIVVLQAMAQVNAEQANIDALTAGALALVEKPALRHGERFPIMVRQLCDQLFLMSDVTVIRQRVPKRLAEGPPANGFRAIGIAASTGGPAALVKVLGELPADFPVPIFLVQHMTAAFMESFTRWLGQNLALTVRIGAQGEVPQPGTVYLAPPDRHLLVEPKGISLDSGPPIEYQRPSATRLFQSLAETHGSRAVGVVLTGIGRDGAEGLKALHARNGYVLVESPATSIVYGMPEAAVALGAVTEQLPVERIGGRLMELAKGSKTT